MRALVVDDDEVFCRFLAEALEEIGIATVYSTNGLAAYQLMNRQPCGLCIIDVRMPLILGTELAEAIKEEYPRVKIILSSAFADAALQEYAKQQGILLLSKPFGKSQLIGAVQCTLRDSQRH
jgi:DNA-binding NtrC family response regulator